MPRSVVNAYEHGTRDPGVGALVRLLAGAGATVAVRPEPDIDVERNARIFEQVLDLAERLPTRRRGRLAFPPLTRLR